MDDNRIIMLFWQRNEEAITAVQQKYGRYCYSIAYRILSNNEDAEECVNDTYIGAWNAIPPHRQEKLSVFLGKRTFDRKLKTSPYAYFQERYTALYHTWRYKGVTNSENYFYFCLSA